MKKTNNYSLIRFAVLLGLACLSPLSIAGGSDNLAAKSAVTDLVYCYAEGADTIGNGKTEANPGAAGLAIFKQCFTDDASFAIWPVGAPFDKLEFPTRDGDKPPLAIIDSPEAWAGMSNQAFRTAAGVGYDFVQHNLTNVQVEVNGNEARATAYLSSVHIIQGEKPPAPTRCRQQANGTYSMKMKKTKGGWRIYSLDLAQISYDVVVENGAGCSAQS